MRRELSPLAEAIMEEKGLLCRSLSYHYKTKTKDFVHTTCYILQKGVYLHLGCKRSCEEFLYALME